MDQARIAELLQPYLGADIDQRLTTNDLHSISIYIDLLQRWNARINLTAIRNEEEIVTRHFGESLFAARRLFPLCSSVPSVAKGLEVADVGSGAGFPGIPIKLWAAQISLTLIESNHKKATFLGEVTRALTLTDVNIKNDRAEALAGLTFEVVTLRAVERFNSILPVAARLVAPGGRLALLIGSAQYESAQAALPSFTWQDPLPIPGSQSRIVAIGKRPQQAESRDKDDR